MKSPCFPDATSILKTDEETECRKVQPLVEGGSLRQQDQSRHLASKSEHRSLLVHLGEGDLVLALGVRKLMFQG